MEMLALRFALFWAFPVPLVLFPFFSMAVVLRPSSLETSRRDDLTLLNNNPTFNKSFLRGQVIKRGIDDKYGLDQRSYSDVLIRGREAMAKLECGPTQAKDTSSFQVVGDLKKNGWGDWGSGFDDDERFEEIDKGIAVSLSAITPGKQIPTPIKYFRGK